MSFRRFIRRTVGALALTATAAAVALVVPHGPLGPLPQAAAAISCDDAHGGTKFYPGDDSSRTYNRTFTGGPTMNHWLQDYVPQGLALWQNWKGTQDVFLVAMHHREENSHSSLLYAMTTSGTRLGSLYLPVGAHAGSVKVYGGWMYVQQNNDMIRRYSLRTVRNELSEAGMGELGRGTELAIGAIDVSFFDIYRGYLYAGHFNDDNRDWMVRYRITSSGGLDRDERWGRVQVPKKTQGLFVSADTYYFSTSSGRNNRSNIYVVRRGYTSNIENTRYRCFRAPVLSQDLERYGGRLYLIFEGGADHFDGNFPWTTADNKIKNLHDAPLSRLHSMVW